MAAAAGGALLLVVGGECGGAGPLGLVLEALERGIRSWDVDLGACSLDRELKAFVSQHSATFSSLVRGQRSLHHRGDALETLVLLNPSDKSLCDELRNLLLVPAPHKLLVLAGPCLEETGELLLQTGGFSFHHFLQVLEEREIRDLLGHTVDTAGRPTLTLGCPPFGDWTQLGAADAGLPGHRLRLNPAARLPACAGLREFLDYLAGSLEPPSPFDLLEPPSSGDILKLDPPCCYIFPGGLGDAAFFAVSDFTVLVNGGSNPKAAFWKLVRHVDRVDAVLVTHAGADSLPGVNSLLRRKVAEREAGPRPPASPGLGVVFLHARESARRLLGGEDEAEAARGLLARLGMVPLPLRRSTPAAPTVLLEKLGVGRLDLHALHPPAAASACALLVWLPADPAARVVRALFPGRTPPARLLEGLGRLQHLGVLREPVVTARDLRAPGRAGSRDSLGPERPGAARTEASRRTLDGEARPARAASTDPRGGGPRTQPRTQPREARCAAPSLEPRSGLRLPLRAASPHDVDLCLVSPCEFAHRRAAPAPPGSSTDRATGSRTQEQAAPETPTPPALPGPEPAADAPGAPRDPLPVPLKDGPPPPDPPDPCTVDPDVPPPASSKAASNTGRARKPLARSTSGSIASRAAPAAAVKSKGPAGGDRARGLLGARSEPSDKAGRVPLSRKPTVPRTSTRSAAGPASSRPAGAASPPGPPVYLDLAYLPGGSAGSLDAEFFLRVRSLCYVISGQDQRREQELRAVLDALLDAKRQWDRDLQVTLVPTFDSVAMRKWFEETSAQQRALGVRVLGSSSMVFTEDDAFPACKLVF